MRIQLPQFTFQYKGLLKEGQPPPPVLVASLASIPLRMYRSCPARNAWGKASGARALVSVPPLSDTAELPVEFQACLFVSSTGFVDGLEVAEGLPFAFVADLCSVFLAI